MKRVNEQHNLEMTKNWSYSQVLAYLEVERHKPIFQYVDENGPISIYVGDIMIWRSKTVEETGQSEAA